MGCMTWEETLDGLAWEWITTPRPLPWRAFAGVALDGHSQLSASDTPADHRRFRWQ